MNSIIIGNYKILIDVDQEFGGIIIQFIKKLLRQSFKKPNIIDPKHIIARNRHNISKTNIPDHIL